MYAWMKECDDITFRLVKVQGHAETNEMFWNVCKATCRDTPTKRSKSALNVLWQLPLAAFGTSSYCSRLVIYECHFQAISISIFNFASSSVDKFSCQIPMNHKKPLCHLSTTARDAFMQNSQKFLQSKNRSAVDVGRGTKINDSKC